METIFTLFIVPTLVCLLSFNAYAQESRPPRPGAGQEEFRERHPGLPRKGLRAGLRKWIRQ